MLLPQEGPAGKDPFRLRRHANGREWNANAPRIFLRPARSDAAGVMPQRGRIGVASYAAAPMGAAKWLGEKGETAVACL